MRLHFLQKRRQLSSLSFNLIVFCLFFSYQSMNAQFHRIDSLKNEIKKAATPQEKLATLIALSNERNSLSGDSLLVYTKQIKALATQLNDKNGLAWADYNFKSHLFSTGKTDSVFNALEADKEKITKLKDRKLYYKNQLLYANTLARKNRLNDGINFEMQLLNEAEKEGDIYNQLFIELYLGVNYYNLRKFDEARQWYFKGLALIEKSGVDKYAVMQSYFYSNLIFYYVFLYQNDTLQAHYDSSLMYANKAIDISAKTESMGTLAGSYVQKADLMSRKNKFTEAEKNFLLGQEIRNKIGDPFYKINDLISLGNFYYNSKQYQKSIAAAEEGMQVAKTNNIRANDLNLLELKSINYKALNNYEAYSKVLEQYIAVSDSNNKVNASQQLAEIQTKYDVQKKETEIAEQKFTLLKRKNWLYGSFGLSGLGLLIGYFGFKNYRSKQQLKMELASVEEKKQKELAVRNAEEKERTRIAADLHDNIGVQASAILYGTELLQQENTEGKHIVDNLYDTAKEMLLNLRETLWAMKNTDIPAADLWIRVINFSKQMGRHYTDINFTTQGSPPQQLILESAKALNILMIVQEAVNNAAKHAKAKNITIESVLTNTNWQLTINDDGKGFDMEIAKQKMDSNGLGNMQQRAKQANASINFNSEKDKGTQIIVQTSIT